MPQLQGKDDISTIAGYYELKNEIPFPFICKAEI
uniref:Uncharacterized protein n=1 Tax=Anguilla anguilla TaxID=7936 RepID=A0A0E9RTQ0_ANGAN